jgi:hypothetical protein
MAGYDYAAYNLGPGASNGARSFSTIFAAIAAVCVVSGALVMGEQASTPSARAATAAAPATWNLESRWWSGDVRPVSRPATAPDSDLTFTKGYQLRLAARQASAAQAPARLAAALPPSETQFGRPARKPTVVARVDGASLRTAPRSDAMADRPTRFDASTEATLAFGEQRPAFPAQGGLFPNIFGILR